MNDKIPTPIVDKNGKQTTVHKNAAPVVNSRNLPTQPSTIPGYGKVGYATIVESGNSVDKHWLEKHRVEDEAGNRERFASEGEVYPNGYITALYDNGGIFFVNENDEYIFAPLVEGYDISAISVSPIVQPTDNGYNIAYNAELYDEDFDGYDEESNEVVTYSIDSKGDKVGSAQVIAFAETREASDFIDSLAHYSIKSQTVL